MKKIFAFIMGICFAFSIASCSGNSTVANSTDTDSVEVVADTVSVDSATVAE